MKFYDVETDEEVSIGTISGATLSIDIWYFTQTKPKCKDTSRSFILRNPEITFHNNTMCIAGFMTSDNGYFKLKCIELRTKKK